jgi:hypothetical protein
VAGSGKNPSTQKPKKKTKRDVSALEVNRIHNRIESLRGYCEGDGSLVDELHEMRQEKSFTERRGERRKKSLRTASRIVAGSSPA